MNFIDFEGSNCKFSAPEGMTEEQVLTIPAMKHIQTVPNEKGEMVEVPAVIVCIQPSEEDRAAIAAGRPIWVNTWGAGFSPMSIFTMNADNSAANP